MGSSWRKVKMAFGLNLCLYGPKNLVADSGHDEDSLPPSERRSDAALLSPPPTPASYKLRLSKSLSRSSKKTCSICLASMRQGDGQAIFTAECSHSFHFHCIASNVKHGSQVCPICRAKWKDIPFHHSPGNSRINPHDSSQDSDRITLLRRPPPAHSNFSPQFPAFEPVVFDDDEPLDRSTDPAREQALPNQTHTDSDDRTKVCIKTYTEVSSIPKSTSVDNFTVLIHLRAPASGLWHHTAENGLRLGRSPRAPIDLVTVLDTSGSMAGTKLALLKRAMGFVVQSLGPNDRLSVIAFSSTAHRFFPLRLMSESGRQQALQAVNSLVAGGGTNIAEGLRKGAKVMDDRKQKNPVSSIILLSDGQDTYTVNGQGPNTPDYELLLPSSIIPVHAFGFGADHDASSMHSISEISGGTFSFIEAEGAIQDAFAQCIGGLLSVVVKDLRISIECAHPDVCLSTLEAGSYPGRVGPDHRAGYIDVGDLYADEERDFLVSVSVPDETEKFGPASTTALMNVTCAYKDPLRNEAVTLEEEHVVVERTMGVGAEQRVSVEVDRQRNRVLAAEAMARARAAAENGELGAAAGILESVRGVVSGSVSGRAGDSVCVALDGELREMQERMSSRDVYRACGRAYILSGLSSHSWQRATARGNSVEGSVAYQTPSMVEMVTRSQASLGRLLRPVWSFGSPR